MKNKIACAIHGGASSEGISFKKEHEAEIRECLNRSAATAWKILEDGGTAVDAVTQAVIMLEDNELFNCGRGSALNSKGQIDMDALIMDGQTLNSGAVTLVRNVKNPIALAKEVMTKTKCLLLGGAGALEFAKLQNMEMKPDSYFLTAHQMEEFKKESAKKANPLSSGLHGTVGAVAIDKHGNVAAAASTGGICMKNEGRIGDTPMIGIGAYANNETCAAAATGDGEVVMKHVLTHHLSCLLETEKYSLQEACDYLVKTKIKQEEGDVGVISVGGNGEIGISFNTKAMPRAWKFEGGNINVAIFKE